MTVLWNDFDAYFQSKEKCIQSMLIDKDTEKKFNTALS